MDSTGFLPRRSTGQIVTALATSFKNYWLWYALAIAGGAVFLFWPGGFAEKARLVLHGLCAQTPSHTFTFGGLMLPFDARMTGIYGGALSTLVILAAQRRLLSAGLPSLRVLCVLGLFVAMMAADGFNSLFTDLGLWHPWTSRNELRLITGYATGVTLAIVLAWLVGSTVWRLSSREPAVQTVREIALFWVPFIPYAGAVMSGASGLYVPLSMLLMVSAWIVLSMLMLAMLLLAFRWDDRIRASLHLHVPGTIAGIGGLGVMLLLAFGRVWLETTLGIPTTL
jgi:uncharacterized membrane protein